MSTVPSVRFALPGQWVKAELNDPAAVAALQDQLPADYRGAGAWVESLRAAGAQTLLLRPGSTPPAAIVFIWPAELSRGDASPAALRARLGIEGEPVKHERDYAALRQRATSESTAQDVVTYALAHPETGRVLLVRCIAFDGLFEDYMVDDFNLAAGNLAWDET
ncbi:hypothetical protein [Aeromicrobium wangtongii]|uniref:hypothetical protein n=1 Tax=Aeromicrobium wangtongii TaxID=2969247 RepID=UPI002017EAB0|nr:hypothetical protein [Aeromicrobium wangtongii]MCL3820367.1 hypothetical protein [Aeromicrobium wangtongii]